MPNFSEFSLLFLVLFCHLHRIFNTFVVALPNLVQVGSLLLLLLTIYAVLGEFLFAKVMIPGSAAQSHPGGLNSHANFQTFGNALLTLTRMSTGEALNEIMWACSRERSILHECLEAEQDYADIVAQGPRGCGPNFAIAYFISFIIIGVFIMTNMFISIILDGYKTTNEQEKMRINDATVERFKETWMKYDPNAGGLIHIDSFKELVLDLAKMSTCNHIFREDLPSGTLPSL